MIVTPAGTCSVMVSLIMDRKRGCSILKFYLFAPRFILLHPVHRPAVQILWFCGQGNIKGKLGGDVLVETIHLLGDGERSRLLALGPHHHRVVPEKRLFRL